VNRENGKNLTTEGEEDFTTEDTEGKESNKKEGSPHIFFVKLRDTLCNSVVRIFGEEEFNHGGHGGGNAQA
jgi:hypothetical protein